MPSSAVGAIFAVVAVSSAAIGVWTSSWYPFAGAVVAAALAGLAWTEPADR